MRISDWSSDVCSSDLLQKVDHRLPAIARFAVDMLEEMQGEGPRLVEQADIVRLGLHEIGGLERFHEGSEVGPCRRRQKRLPVDDGGHLLQAVDDLRSAAPTSELQSLLSTSYAVFCLKKKTQHYINKYYKNTKTQYT